MHSARLLVEVVVFKKGGGSPSAQISERMGRRHQQLLALEKLFLGYHVALMRDPMFSRFDNTGE